MQDKITTIAELFENLATMEDTSDNIKRVEKVFGAKIKDIVTRELINSMGDSPLVLEGGVSLLSIDDVCVSNPSTKLVPIFGLENNIKICYNLDEKNYCKLNARNGKTSDTVPAVNAYFRDELEGMEESTIPDGENVSIPFIMDYKDTQVVVVFGYDMCKDNKSSFFAVKSIVVEYDEYEETFGCDLRVAIDAKKWQDVYKPILDTYALIGDNPKAIAELDKFLKTDMTNPILRKKYKGLIDFMEKEETDLMEAHSIIASDEELTEKECYDLVHKYSNHAKVAPLYEKVVEYVRTLKLDV